MKYLNYIFFLTVMLAFSCDPEGVAVHDTGDDTAPQNVADMTVTPTVGGGILNYTLPMDEDLLYVKARYEIAPGRWRESKSSVYARNIELDGFDKVGEKTVYVSTEDREGNVSEENEVAFSPLEPQYITTQKSLETQETWGGINVKFHNQVQKELALICLVKDVSGGYVESETYYTTAKEEDINFRGYEDVKQTFGLVVRDRWGNYSDTLLVEHTPWFEMEIDRTKYKKMKLPGEPSLDNWHGLYKEMIDGITGQKTNYGHTKGNTKLPVVFTIDMQQDAKLSRFILWQRRGGYIYKHHNPKVWELWGSAKAPAPDGSDEGFVKLGEYHCVKPSGRPSGDNTEEDKIAAAMGDELILPLDAPVVRYLRFKMFESWTGGLEFMAAEIAAFGAPPDKLPDTALEKQGSKQND
ncbi:MAG: DUF5126 domain-containing protein [Cytophagales bacterium]|nr:DUF5126 domain-containing protein [Cytophagales bacterium]